MDSSQRRVVVTGVSAISPLGLDQDSFVRALSDRRSGVGPLTCLPSDAAPVPFAGQADDFQGKIGDFGDLPKDQSKTIRKALRMMCRECQMGVAAGQRALLDAGVGLGDVDPLRIGVSFNSDYMITLPDDLAEGIVKCLDDDGEFVFPQWPLQGMPQMNPLWQLKYLPNMPAAHLAIFNELRGPNNSVTVREAGVGAALGEAFHIIADGKADLMLTGGTGTRLHPIKLIHAVQTEQLASGDGDPAEACRPFDRDRQGMICGEGAGGVVIEELEHAKSRGATIHAELLGGAYTASLSTDRHARRREALVNAMRLVFQKTGLSPEDVDHINAHGLATTTCDAEEAAAIHEVFGQRASSVPVMALKSYFGNLGGGSGVVELIGSMLAMREGRLFSTLNYTTPDDQHPLNIVTDEAAPGDVVLKLSVSPQGQAGAALIRRYEG